MERRGGRGTWRRESWVAKKCDGNGLEGTWCGVQGGMWVKGGVGCMVGARVGAQR